MVFYISHKDIAIIFYLRENKIYYGFYCCKERYPGPKCIDIQYGTNPISLIDNLPAATVVSNDAGDEKLQLGVPIGYYDPTKVC